MNLDYSLLLIEDNLIRLVFDGDESNIAIDKRQKFVVPKCCCFTSLLFVVRSIRKIDVKL